MASIAHLARGEATTTAKSEVAMPIEQDPDTGSWWDTDQPVDDRDEYTTQATAAPGGVRRSTASWTRGRSRGSGTCWPGEPSPPATPSCHRIAPGEHIGSRYRLLTRLGRGGTAEVWRAHDQLLGRPVAVKLPRPRALIRPRPFRNFQDQFPKFPVPDRARYR